MGLVLKVVVRWARRAAITVAGVAVVLIGLVLVPLPGPGWLIVLGGIALLGREYESARRLHRWSMARLRSVAGSTREHLRRRFAAGSRSPKADSP
jgi:uncharacterized protein (TIGR02611 family)